jgi:hypothetical protein
VANIGEAGTELGVGLAACATAQIVHDADSV